MFYWSAFKDLPAIINTNNALPSSPEQERRQEFDITRFCDGGDPERRHDENIINEDMQLNIHQRQQITSSSAQPRKLQNLPFSFWIFTLTILCLYNSVIPLVNILSDVFQSRFNIPNTAKYNSSPVIGGLLLAIPDLVSTVIVGDVGEYMNDAKFLRKKWLLLVCSLSIGVIHFGFYVTCSVGERGLGLLTLDVLLLISLGCIYAVFSSVYILLFKKH